MDRKESLRTIFKAFVLPISLFSILFIAKFFTLTPHAKLFTYKPALSTNIYDRNGTLLQQVYADENRVWVELENIDQDLIDATIAIEDHRFYEHPGIDPIAIVRAAKSTFIDGDLEGGSTLTQQYIKNALLTKEKTYERKVKEAYLALLLESFYKKDAILEKYLNQAAYGGVNYGVETASRYYFNTSSSDLTIAQAAVLAALPKAPSELSPQTNQEDLIQRQRTVLDKMLQFGFITEEEHDQAYKEELTFALQSPPFKAPHFTQAVKQQLINEYGEEKVLTGGLEVKTTLDLSIQEESQKIVREEIDNVERLHITNGSAVVLEPSTAEVLAMVGSRDYFDEEIDGQFNVIYGKRQPGSSIKPFTYALALKNGYTPATMLLDIKTTYKTTQGDYKPVNYDGKYRGPVTVRQALGSSLNIPATRMLAVLGVNNYVSFLHELGFDYIRGDQVGLSLTLGGTEVHPLDMAAAYGALANQGKYQEPKLFLSIKENGKELYKPENRSNQVFSKEIAYLISDILSDNNARTTTFGPNSQLNVPEHKVAVKTGTSNDKRDNWTIGYTPEFVVAVWVGNNDHTPMYSVASGITGATPIWRKITDHLIEKQPPTWYEQPSSITTAAVDANTGQKYCDKGKKIEELFIEGTQPSNCASTTVKKMPQVGPDRKVLVEKRDGQEVQVAVLTSSELQLFNSDPFAYIEQNKNILQADDKPTEIYVKDAGTTYDKEVAQYDPLAQRSDKADVIDLTQ